MQHITDMTIKIDARAQTISAAFEQRATSEESRVTLLVDVQLPYRSDLTLGEIQREASQRLRALLS